MDAGIRALSRGISDVAIRELARAREVARGQWLHSLVTTPYADICAAVGEADAALHLASATGSVGVLREATSTLPSG